MASVTRVEISPAQRTYYDELFRLADTDGDGVIGVKDAGFFRKSGLADAVLGEVWQMADPRKEGVLDRDGFTVALSLISIAQQGKPLALHALRPAPPPPKLVDVPAMKVEVPTSPAQPQWTIPVQDRMQYQNIFRQADDDNDGFITGNQARGLFGNSGLPMPVLGQIWSMADINQDQKLDFPEFCIAMYLIGAKKKGQELPPALPESLIASARSDAAAAPISSPQIPSASFGLTSTMQNEWIIPPAERIKFEDLFKKSDTDHDGYITGEQARALFGRSGLPNTELGKIWVLSDINQDQKLDKQEFYIAMALINRRLNGLQVPVALPEALTISARDSALPSPAAPAPVPAPAHKRNYDVDLNDLTDSLSIGSAHTTPAQSPALQHTLAVDQDATSSTPIQSPSTTTPRFGVPPGSASLPSSAIHQHGMSPNISAPASIPGSAIPPHMASYPGGVMSPHISASGGLPPQGYAINQSGGVPLTHNPTLELERTRQAAAQHERAKTEANKRLQEETAASNEVAQQLAEERAKVDALAAEVRELENQINNQKNRGASIRDQLNGTRLEKQSIKAQKDQLEVLLKEKTEQCTEQEELLAMLNAELTEKTTEVADLQRNVDQAKVKLESLKNASADVKHQLVGVKKQIVDSKSELYKINEESKLQKPENRRFSGDLNTTSPNVPLRPISPAVFPQTSTSPPNARASPSITALEIKNAQNSPASLSKSSPFTPSPTFTSTTDFNFNGKDTFNFDNGKEDPFAHESKDGFGFGQVTQDSFGSSESSSVTASPPFAKPSDPSSFFGGDAFGETKNPFPSNPNDPFASVRETFGGSSFGFGGGDSFGSPSVPRTPANSVIAPPTPANSVIAPPTPANSVIAGSIPATPANSVIAVTATPANSVIANTPPTPANSVIAPKDGSHQPFTEEAFKSSFFAATSFDNDAFGSFETSDAFGSNDAFGSTTEFGTTTEFGSTTEAFGGSSDSFGGGADSFGSTVDSFGSTTNDTFGTSDTFGGATSTPFGDTNDAFATETSDTFGGDHTNDAFGSVGNDTFGKKKSEFDTPANDAFGTTDAFGSSPFTNTFDFTTDKNENFFQ